MAAVGKPVHPAWIVAGGTALAAMFVFAALLMNEFRWPGTARLLAVVATAATASAVCIASLRWHKRLEREGTRPRMTAFLRTAGPAVFLAGIIVTQAVVLRSLIGALATYGYMLPIFLGSGLIGAGVTRRIGATRHCPKCEYEFGFQNEVEAPIRCPECGVGWLGRLVTGRRVRSIPLMMGGAAIIAVPLVFLFGRFSFGVSRLMPTPVLVVWLSAAGTRNEGAWADLVSRGISAEQRAWLAGRLLDRREVRGRRLGRDAGEWLEAEAVGGTLPAEVTARFFDGIFTADLGAPRRVQAGRPFRISLRDMDDRSEDKYDCYIYIAGFGIGDVPATAGRRNEAYSPRLEYFPMGSAEGGDGLGAEFTIGEPGVYKARAELWVTVQGDFPDSITWNDDGTPNLPAATVWSNKVVLEREVEVVP